MTPTAPSAYILSRQLGGDTEAMASIITVQTLIAFLDYATTRDAVALTDNKQDKAATGQKTVGNHLTDAAGAAGHQRGP